MHLSPPEPPLGDGVVTLRLPDERDLEAIERALADPEISRAFDRLGMSAVEILDWNRRRWSEGAAATFAICSGSDRCVGHVFVNLGESGRASVGYWLLPEGRGRGLATLAVKLISKWAFDALGVERMALLTEPWNEASQRVAERAGFTREGVLRSYAVVNGRRVDHVSFSLLSGEL